MKTDLNLCILSCLERFCMRLKKLGENHLHFLQIVLYCTMVLGFYFETSHFFLVGWHSDPKPKKYSIHKFILNNFVHIDRSACIDVLHEKQ